MFAQRFDVAQQLVRRVHRQIGAVGHMRGGSTAAALVEQNDAVGGRIEELPYRRLRAAAGTAVQEHHRLAVRISADFPVHALAVTDVEETGHKRLDRRIEIPTNRRLC